MAIHRLRQLASVLTLCLALLVSWQPRASGQEEIQTYADHLTAGILIEDTREILKQGVEFRTVYRRGIDELKLSEGFVSTLYNDAASYCTIAYGHLIKKRSCNGSESAEYLDGITVEEAEALLIEDLVQAQIVVLNSTTINLTDGQYAALVSFAFNVGAKNFRNSKLLQVVNAGQFDRVPMQFRRWVRAGGRVFQGLVNRREREIALFFDGQAIPRSTPRPDEDLSPMSIDVAS